MFSTMLSTKYVPVFTLLCLTTLISACGNSGPKGGPRSKTVPLTGIVLVDGKPTEGVTVSCHPLSGDANNHVLSGRTDASGNVAISTYVSGDGVPPGSYTLTFEWLKKGEGMAPAKDVFKGRYADPKKSEYKITAAEGEPAQLKEIKLTTK
tara:strand:+ start:7739 stop:8191 length:453 start_codon:yes stop_codon:yes gene_type:complete